MKEVGRLGDAEIQAGNRLDVMLPAFPDFDACYIVSREQLAASTYRGADELVFCHPETPA